MSNDNSNRQTQVLDRLTVLVSIVVLTYGGYALAQSEATISSPPDDTTEYLIGPGDTISIDVWREPELSLEAVPVRPDGLISTPRVEDMQAVGKTPTRLARDIEEVLSEWLISPQVTVIVEQFVGTFDAQIRVIGQVENPGRITFRENMTMLDVLFEVEGLTEFARGNRSRLVRNVDGQTQEIRVRLDDLYNKGDLSENVDMRPGDTVVVPEAKF